MKAFVYKGYSDFSRRTTSAHKALFEKGWYHWLGGGKRGGLKAKFGGLNFPGLLN